MEQTVNYGCMAAYCFLPLYYYAQDSFLTRGTLLGEEMKIYPTSRNLQWITMKNIFHKFLNKLDLIFL